MGNSGSLGKLSKKDKRAAKIAKQKEQAAGKEENENKMEEEEDEDIGETMEDEAGASSGDPKTCVIAFKQIIVDILQKNDLDQKRAAKMEILDFLTLLNLFNQQGIHFT